MIVYAIQHKRNGGRISRLGKRMDVRRGRKLVPGSTTTFQGAKWKVTGYGYERGCPVVHLSPLV